MVWKSLKFIIVVEVCSVDSYTMAQISEAAEDLLELL